MAGDELETFILDMLAQKQLPGVTPEVKNQLVIDLKQRLVDQINQALINALPDERFEAFNNLLDSDATDEAVQSYMIESGINVQQVTIDTMLRFRSLYLGVASTKE